MAIIIANSSSVEDFHNKLFNVKTIDIFANMFTNGFFQSDLKITYSCKMGNGKIYDKILHKILHKIQHKFIIIFVRKFVKFSS